MAFQSSSNVAQSLGAALLAGGFYGPPEGELPRRTEAGLLETRTHDAGSSPRPAPASGIGRRIRAVLPVAEDDRAAGAVAISIARVAELAGITGTQAATNIGHITGVRRIGERRRFRYYQAPAK